MKQQAKIKAVLYCRVTCDDQLGTSIKKQKNLLLEVCKKANLEPVATYMDVHTGFTIERPGLKQMIADLSVKKIKAEAIFVERLDRLGRQPEMLEEVLKRLKGISIKVGVFEKGFKPWEDEELSTKSNKEHLFEAITNVFLGENDGKVNSRDYVFPVPFGYRILQNELVPHPKESEILKSIFNEVNHGESPEFIFEMYGGSKVFGSFHAFEDLLVNPVYAGRIEIFHDKETDVLHSMPGNHPAIISEPIFWNVAKIIGDRYL